MHLKRYILWKIEFAPLLSLTVEYLLRPNLFAGERGKRGSEDQTILLGEHVSQPCEGVFAVGGSFCSEPSI